MKHSPSAKPQFKIGDNVRIDNRDVVGHNRTPWYIRGKTGVITEIQGRMHEPSRMAYHKPGLPLMYWYKVRFRQADIWPRYKGDAIDQLELDVQEDWLLAPKGKKK